uniref:Uncharacterized protein n=1 Tax=Rhizophora mucronata TaxID=61149 RepID=A0A2P2JW11_RHIMU
MIYRFPCLPPVLGSPRHHAYGYLSSPTLKQKQPMATYKVAAFNKCCVVCQHSRILPLSFSPQNY